MRQRSLVVLAALPFAFGFAVSVGCGSEPPPAPVAPVAPAATEKPVVAAPPAASSAPKRPVNVSDEIRRLCSLPEPKDAPRFDFDTSDVVGDDRTTLQALAKCMTDGPLKGRSVRLVGRADPRGEQEYNMALGAKRSSNVKQYMTSLGIGDARLLQTSRGELDAKGTDEDTWRLDRRVDIELAK